MRRYLIGLVILALLVNPISSGSAAQPFPTVVPPEVEFDPAFVEPLPPTITLGTEFFDASGIDLGPITKDPLFGWYGFATLADDPTHKLIWFTDADGIKHYQIVSVTDPLLSDFESYVRDLAAAEDALVASASVYGTAWLSLIIAEVAACGPSAGGGCIAALLTAAVGIVSAGVWGIWTVLTRLLPAERNIVQQYDLILENQ